MDGGAGFDQEIGEFMREVELSAKRVLTRANKQRQEELFRARAGAARLARQGRKARDKGRKHRQPGSPGKGGRGGTSIMPALDPSDGSPRTPRAGRAKRTPDQAAAMGERSCRRSALQQAGANTLSSRLRSASHTTGAMNESSGTGFGTDPSVHGTLPAARTTWPDSATRAQERTAINSAFKISDKLRSSPLFSAAMDAADVDGQRTGPGTWKRLSRNPPGSRSPAAVESLDAVKSRASPTRSARPKSRKAPLSANAVSSVVKE